MTARLLQELYARHGLPGPDGRGLFAYRLPTAQWEELRGRLRGLGRTRRLNDFTTIDAGALCLYIAEWWRREHAGGAWRWEGVLDSLEWRCAVTELYPLLRRGLRYLDRPLREQEGRRLYLMTLAGEGGLPLLLVQREGVHLRRFFRGLFRELSLYGDAGDPATLARRREGLLPGSLRNEGVFAVAGALAREIWRLQPLVAGATDPIAELDARRPGWRDSLPLDIDDGPADALLRGLVDAARVARSTRRPLLELPLFLLRTERGFRLERRLCLAPEVSAEQLAQLLDADVGDLPARVTLRLGVRGSAAQRIALASRRGDLYRLEALCGDFALGGDQATRASTLDGLGGGSSFGPATLDYQATLGELPWVFRADADADKEADQEANPLLGQGALRSRAAELWVALGAGQTIEPSGAGRCESAGELEGIERRVFIVSGTAVVVDDSGARMTLRCGAESDAHAQYELRGAVLPFQSAARGVIYRGTPQLYELDDEKTWRRVPASALRFRLSSADGGRAEWCPLEGAPWGTGTVEYSVDAEPRFRARIARLPLFDISLYGRDKGGTVSFEGLGTERVGIECPADLACESLACESRIEGPDLAHFELTAAPGARPPRRLQVEAAWQDGGRVCFDVPYPGRYADFVDAAGTPLRRDAATSIAELGTLAAEAFSPRAGDGYILRARRLCGHDVPAGLADAALGHVTVSVDGDHPSLFSLATLEPAIARALASSRDISAAVELCLEPQGVRSGPAPRLRVCRFAERLVADTAAGRVTTPQPTPSVHLQALPLWDAAGLVDLPEVSNSAGDAGSTSAGDAGSTSWDFAPDTRAPGPWLILGWQRGWLRFRPLLWKVAERQDAKEDPSPRSAHSVQSISLIADNEARQRALATLISSLAKDPAHTDWPIVDGFMATMRRIPPATFDVLAAVASDSEALALALLRAPDAESFDLRYDGFEELPASFHCLPVSAWLGAGRLLERQLAAAFPDNEETVRELIGKRLHLFCERAPQRLSGLGVIAELLAEHLHFETTGKPCLPLFRAGAGLQMLQTRIGEWHRTLHREHVDDRWPGWDDARPWRARLCSATPTLSTLFASGVLAVQRPFFDAPVIAALMAATEAIDTRPQRSDVLGLERLRAFAPQAFDEIHGLALAGAVELLER